MKKFLLILILFLGYYITKASASCFSFGLGAIDNYNGTCSCISGYHFENNYLLGTQCVKDPTCFDLYGFGSQDNYNGTCGCRDGYVWGKSLLGKKQCVDANQSCRDDLGIGAEDAGGGYCKCSLGYMMDTDYSGKKVCSLGSSYCRKQYGLYSSYSYSSKSCKCDDGYTLEDGVCIEKQNNIYSLLLQLKTDTKEAKISLDTNNDGYYDNEYYYIKYSGCYSMDIDDYLGKLLVVNLGTDTYLDNRDKLVMIDQNYDCDITSREKVNATYSIYTCEDQYGKNITTDKKGNCICKKGYKLSKNKLSCIKK